MAKAKPVKKKTGNQQTIWILLIVLGVGLAALVWLIVGSGTAFIESKKQFVIEEGATDKASVVNRLKEAYVINNGWMFGLLADKLDVWPRLKAGKYEVKNGESLLSIARKLRNNQQVEVKLVINKVRTKQELARLISKNFAHDSASVLAFLNNNETLKQYDADSNTIMAFILPNTYRFYYTASLQKIFSKVIEAHDAFWLGERTSKARAKGFSPIQIITIASIVEEETNKNAEKGNVASVYINRLRKGMALGADPTIKFALNDFALKRILYGHLKVESPYNTYRNKGLPPGPICTPSEASIDAVLDAPNTNYLFFVADASLNGYHHFSATFAEHSAYAKQYQQALDGYFARKNNP